MTRKTPQRQSFDHWPFAVAVAVLTCIAFLPTLQGEFVSWDDQANFVDNPYYRGLGIEQLKWMWSTFHLGHYVPLSWMTLGADYVLWGMNPLGYHATNLVLHAANAVLVYFVAVRCFAGAQAPNQHRGGSFTNPHAVGASLAALAFAVHPLRVESVAWITERRDVLSLFFLLVSVWMYWRATEHPEHFRRRYLLSLAAFAAALLSKAAVMPLPAVLLALNVYPLRRLGGNAGWWSTPARRVYAEVAPFAALSLGVAALSLVALQPGPQLSAAHKAAVSAYSLAFYLWKTIAPFGLAPLYERPASLDATALPFLISYVLVGAVAALLVATARRRPAVATAFGIFLLMILPFLGAVQNGPQIAADRYTYHAAPALAILAGAAFLRAPKRGSLIAGLGVIGVLMILTWRQSFVWRTSESLWVRVLDRDSTSALANNNYGEILASRGQSARAIEHYRRALVKRPAYPDAHSNWGLELALAGNTDEAIEHYRDALAIRPDFANAEINWGNALVQRELYDEAIRHYARAAEIDPSHYGAHLNWGAVLAQQGKLAEAVTHFEQAVNINPFAADAREYLNRARQELRSRR